MQAYTSQISACMRCKCSQPITKVYLFISAGRVKYRLGHTPSPVTRLVQLVVLNRVYHIAEALVLPQLACSWPDFDGVKLL